MMGLQTGMQGGVCTMFIPLMGWHHYVAEMFATLTANVEHDRDAPMHETHRQGQHASLERSDGSAHRTHMPQN
jgi:hypothetical protein